MDVGFDVRLARSGAIAQYTGIKHSNDFQITESGIDYDSHLI